jgi:hypothetical protein
MTVVLYLLSAGAVALVVSLAMAPVESRGWWAGWRGPDDDPETPEPREAPADTPPPAGCYVVFLSGIGSISGDELLPRESEFLDRLQAALPVARIVRDVFPYAPSGRPLLTGQRVFRWLWRRVLDWRLSGTRWLPAILNLRNLFQALVSADHRYGPLYSFGIARVAHERLAANGYPPAAGVPVILLGSSGGAQVSVGAATYLAAAIDAPLGIVTFGGVMASDRGVGEVARLASLYGTDAGSTRSAAPPSPGAGRWRSARSGTSPGARTASPSASSALWATPAAAATSTPTRAPPASPSWTSLSARPPPPCSRCSAPAKGRPPHETNPVSSGR